MQTLLPVLSLLLLLAPTEAREFFGTRHGVMPESRYALIRYGLGWNETKFCEFYRFCQPIAVLSSFTIEVLALTLVCPRVKKVRRRENIENHTLRILCCIFNVLRVCWPHNAHAGSGAPHMPQKMWLQINLPQQLVVS